MGAYSGLIPNFVNYYDVEARCAFFINARFLMKITSASQIAQSVSQHFLGKISNTPFLYVTSILTKNYWMPLH